MRIPLTGWHTGRVHKWERIAEGIAARIRSGELAPDDVVPSVRALMAEGLDGQPVADVTAKRALDHLVSEGLIRPVPSVGHIVNGGEAGSLAARVKRLEDWRAQVEAREAGA